MCKTTGAGAATNRAFSAVTGPAPARPDKRTPPATTGTKLSIKRAASGFQEGRSEGVMVNG
jgi:hypothetical protein